MHLGKRLLELTEQKKIKKTVLAKELKMSRENVYSIFKREDLDTDLLRNFSAILGMSVSDILMDPANEEQSNIRSISPSSKEVIHHLPLISVKGRASVIEHSLEGCQLKFIEETYPLLFPLIKQNDRQVIIEIEGDSMEPEIRSGAFVLGECVEVNDIRYESNGVYAVLYANRFVLKRIKSNEINEKKRLVLHSDNERYGAITVDAADIRCMWKILRIVDSPVR